VKNDSSASEKPVSVGEDTAGERMCHPIDPHCIWPDCGCGQPVVASKDRAEEILQRIVAATYSHIDGRDLLDLLARCLEFNGAHSGLLAFLVDCLDRGLAGIEQAHFLALDFNHLVHAICSCSTRARSASCALNVHIPSGEGVASVKHVFRMNLIGVEQFAEITIFGGDPHTPDMEDSKIERETRVDGRKGLQ